MFEKYEEFNINVHGYFMKENEIKDQIIPLLEKHRPNLLVITGHDAMKKMVIAKILIVIAY